jgi:hypothetical protein
MVSDERLKQLIVISHKEGRHQLAHTTPVNVR